MKPTSDVITSPLVVPGDTPDAVGNKPNTSHGCLNVSPSNAVWFYDNSKRGDIVEVINTVGSTLPGTDGLGDWNIPWEQWKAGNANI